jgi:hypothetical protein
MDPIYSVYGDPIYSVYGVHVRKTQEYPKIVGIDTKGLLSQFLHSPLLTWDPQTPQRQKADPADF